MMGWSIGYDSNWNRDVGYGVPAHCDDPDCAEEIDRGLAFVCGGEPYGGEHGCGLNFCADHLYGSHNLCQCCYEKKPPFTPKPDHPDWMRWKLRDSSWKEWREKNPASVQAIRDALRNIADRATHPTDKGQINE